MSRVKLDTITDFAHHGYDVKVTLRETSGTGDWNSNRGGLWLAGD
jgi:hypothetical protein